MTATIKYADGRPARECDTYDEAVEILGGQYDDLELCDSWDSNSPDSQRQLAWECEDDSVNDAGQHSVAQIVMDGHDRI